LAQRISELVSDEQRHVEVSKAARARAATFTWTATAEQTAAAYEDALK
jgi:glycosyltransferase involved in cell wall biosynthesis